MYSNFRGILGHKVKLLKFKETLELFSHFSKNMRFKKRSQFPGGGRTRVWHHHGSDTPNSPRAIYVLKSAKRPNIFGGVRESIVYYICMSIKCTYELKSLLTWKKRLKLEGCNLRAALFQKIWNTIGRNLR